MTGQATFSEGGRAAGVVHKASTFAWERRRVLFGAALVALFLARIPLTEGVAQVLAACALIGGALCILWRLPAPERVLLALIASYRLFVLGIDLVFVIVPQLDSQIYHQLATRFSEILENGRSDTTDPFAPAPGEPDRQKPVQKVAVFTFVAPFGVLAFLFGPSLELARLVATLVGSLSCLGLFRLLRLVYPLRISVYTAILYGLWPTLAQIQTDLLRDNLLACGFIWGLYGFCAGLRGGGWRRLVLGGLSLSYAWLLRLSNAVLAPVLMFYLLGRVRSAALRTLVLTLLLAAVLFTFLFPGEIVSYILRLPDFSPEGVAKMRSGWGGGQTAYYDNVTFDTWTDVATFAPLGALLFLTVPLPFMEAGRLGWVVIAENLLFAYPIMLLGGLGFWRGRRKPGWDLRLLAVSLLVVAAIFYGIAEANVGTAVRHRSQFSWLWFVLVPAFFANRGKPWREKQESLDSAGRETQERAFQARWIGGRGP